MNINCLICTDLFVPNAEIYATTCGHTFHYLCLIQWIERSKTCPQCRNKTTEKTINRIYFNFSNTENLDAGTLQYKLDRLQFQYSLKEKDVKTYKEKYKTIKTQSLGLRKEIAELENKLRGNESVNYALKDQITYYKSKAKETDKLNEELVKVKNELKDLECVQAILNGNKEKVNELIRNQTDKQSLALMATTLERTLIDTRRKKDTLEHKCIHIQNEASKYKREYAAIELTHKDLKRDFDCYKENWALEKQHLKKKIEELDKKIEELLNHSPSTSCNRSIKRIITESPAPLPKLNDAPIESPPVPKKVKQIMESDSPYLAVKSNSLSILDHKLTNNTRSLTIVMRPSSDYVYNGLGGHSKIDKFPKSKSETCVKKKLTSAISSSKFKKLNPRAVDKKLKNCIDLTFCRE